MEQATAQQSSPLPKKGFSLTFQLIINTILVILGFVAEYILFSLIFLSTSHSSLAGLGLFFLLIAYVILGIPAIIISVIVMILAHKNLEKNPQVSKRIATFYLLFPIVTLLLIIPPLNLSIVPIALIPILLYDWFFIKIYIESKKSIERTVSTQVSAEKAIKASRNLVLTCLKIWMLLSSILVILTVFIFQGFALIHAVIGSAFIVLFLKITAKLEHNKIAALSQIRTSIVLTVISFVVLVPSSYLLFFLMGASGPSEFGSSLETTLQYLTIIYGWVYSLVSLLFLIVSYFNLKKEINSSREDSRNSSPISNQNQSSPNPDPRFPTLDAQPKSQNTPSDNKKQG